MEFLKAVFLTTSPFDLIFFSQLTCMANLFIIYNVLSTVKDAKEEDQV